MDLVLSDDQKLIAEAAADFLGEACGSAHMRAAAASADGFDRELWQRLAELGWCGVQAPADRGGMGLGWVELALLEEQLGRRLACVPYFDSVVLAATLLRSVGPASAPLLERICSGSGIAAVALDPACAQARPRGDGGWTLTGTWPQLTAAGWADTLLLAARTEDAAPALFAVAAGRLEVRPLETIDATRRCARVAANAIELPPTSCLARGAALDAALARTRDLAAIALAAEQVGVAQQCLDLTLAYTTQRVQFGRSIASFQAVKHRCARLLVATELARSAVHGAAAVADAEPEPAVLAFHAAEALVAAIDAAQFSAQEAIQLHGGVGYTWEFDLHLYFKRAQAASQRLGPVAVWREGVAAQLLDAAA